MDINGMTDERTLTITEYTTAFETWARVACLDKHTIAGNRRLGDVLASSLDYLRALFTDSEARKPDVYCSAFETYLSERDEDDPDVDACRRLLLTITKSCLLKRLVYGGEQLRTVPCPKHEGRWSGIKPEPCPHGCDATCGCLTGWIPEPDDAR